MKASKLILSFIAASTLLAAPLAYAAQYQDEGNVIHRSHIVTGGKTVYGILTVEVGKGDANNCNDMKWLPGQTDFKYKDGDIYQLTDVDVIKGADKGYQCAIENYHFNGNDVKLAYNLKSDDNGNYVPSEPLDQNVDLQ